MAATVRVTEFVSRSGTGTQDITFSGSPGTCKGYILIGTAPGTTNGSEIADCSLGYLFVDGAGGEVSHWQTAEDALTTTNCVSDGSATDLEVAEGATAATQQAAHSAFITDGFRLNWTVEGGSSLFKVIAFFGSDITTEKDNINLSSGDGTEKTTAVSNQADLAFFICRHKANQNTEYGDFRQSFGVAAKVGASIHQVGLHYVHPDNRGTSNAATAVFSNRIAAIIDAGGTNVDHTYEVTTMSATTIGVTTREDLNTASNNIDMEILSVNFNGAVEFDVGTLTMPSSTGDDAQTGVGFKPQFILMGMTQTSAYVVEGGTRQDHVAAHIGITDGTEEHCIGVNAEDSVGTSNCGSIIDDQLVRTLDYLGADEHTGTFSSFDSDGWTTNYTAAPVAHKGFWVAVQTEDTANIGTSAATLLIPTSDATGHGAGKSVATLLLPVSNATGHGAGKSAANLLLPVSSAAGARRRIGTSDADLLIPVSAAVGHGAGKSAANLLIPTSVATGNKKEVGDSAAILLLPTSTATGAWAHTGTSAADLLLPTSTAVGVRKEIGASAANLLIPTSTAVGHGAGKSAAVLLVPVSNAVGVVPIIGPSAATLLIPVSTASGNATSTLIGDSAVDLPIPTSTAVGHGAGQSAATLLLPTSTATGQWKHVGISAANLLIPTSSADGDAVSGGPDVFGPSVATLLLPVSTAAGHKLNIGTSAATLPLPTSSATAPSGMVVVQENTNVNVKTSALLDIAYSVDVTAGSLLVMYLSARYNSALSWSITGITDTQSNTWQVAKAEYDTDTGRLGAQIWYAMNASAGATTLTITATRTSGFWYSIGVQEISGIHLTDALDTTGGGYHPTTGQPSVTADDLSSQGHTFLAGVTSQPLAGSDAWTHPAGYAELYDQPLGPAGSLGLPGHAAYKIENTADTEVASWSRGAGGEFVAAIAVFKKAPVLGTSAATLLLPTSSSAGKASAAIGPSAAVLPLPTSTAAGNATSTLIGNSAITLPVPIITTVGSTANIGISAPELLLPISLASGNVVTTNAGTSAITLPLPTQVSTGTRVTYNIGASAATLPLPASSALAFTGNFGSSTVLLPLPTSTASGVVAVHGLSTVTIPLPIHTAVAGAITYVETVTYGTWSVPVEFNVSDSFFVVINGPAASDVKVSTTLEFQER